MKRTFLLCVIASLAFINIQAQGTRKAALAQIKASGSYDTLIYYGVDFSHVRVNDAPKISRSVEYSQVYPAAWIAYVEKELPMKGIVQRALRFPTFLYRQHEIFETSVKANPNMIIGYNNSIPPDTLASIVSHYSLEAKSGLGLVLIPETFSKPKETATTWVVFFDIGSRRIIYKTKIFGKCSHMGYTAHWGSGVVQGFKYFANH